MIIIKNERQINGIRQSSRLAAQTLEYLSAFVKPGVNTLRLNELGHEFILKNKATPAPLGYNGYPKSICTSINNVVCHGIPSEKDILKEGDIVNLDVTTILDGYYGDTSATFPVGNISPKAALLIERAKNSLEMSIKSLKPGKRLNDCVGKVIQPFVEQFGYSVVRELGGHGVGVKFHEDPFVFHFDNRINDVVLKPGMIFTIEPMINMSSDCRIYMDKNDGWTIYTKDGCISAQFEHTVLITPAGYEVLTKI